MLNKDNYVMWSSRLLCYAKSKPNRKLIYNSIINSPYVGRLIPEPGDPDREVHVAETFHEKTDNELTENKVKQMEKDDQAIQTILMGLSEDIYAVVDSCETAQEIWLHVQQMMKEKIANNLKFLNNLQPEWKRHITIVRQTKDLHEVDYTQVYDFLKMNQKEGFAAALAVLITRASQSRQHGKSEPVSYYLPDYAVNLCSAFLCPDSLLRLPMDIRLKIDLENQLKKAQEKDKIRSKPDKNEKRGKAGKSLKQLQ
nr:hypothetical protein [Tanacetum cinerariifolium]